MKQYKRKYSILLKTVAFITSICLVLMAALFTLWTISDISCSNNNYPKEKSYSEPELNQDFTVNKNVYFKETETFARSTRGPGELDLMLKWIDGYGTIIGYLNSIKAADVDNDNETEIVFGNSEGYVYVVSNSENGFIEEWHTMVGIYAFGLSLDDVDDDGTIEIVVGDSEGYINIFGFDGITYQNEWTSPDLGSDLYGLTTADVDDDGVIEIIAGASVSEILDDNIFVFSWQGLSYTLEWNFALIITLGYLGIFNIDVGDVDGDGFKEIVFATYESEMLQNDPPVNPIPPNPRPTGQLGGRFYVFGYSHGSGTLEWQSDDFGEWILGLDVANTDFDFLPEIVITVYLGEVYVFGYNGLTYFQEWVSSGLSAYALTTGWIGNPFFNRVVISSWENIFVYEYSAGSYVEVWASPDLDSFVYGLGIGDIDDNEFLDEILTGTNYRFYSHLYAGNDEYEVLAESNNIGAMECISSGDLDGDGTKEIYLGTGNGSVLVATFDGDSCEIDNVISLSNRAITHLAVSDVDDDGEDELITIEGHTSITWNENFIFRSASSDAVVYILGFLGSDYVVESQINVDTGGTWALDVGDIDEDGIPEILLGGTGYDEINGDPFVGQIEVIDYNGLEYEIVWESEYFDDWVMGVAIGDVDGDGLNEIATEDYDEDMGSDVIRLYEWSGATYIEFQTIQVESENYALDVGDIDQDGTVEIASKGIFSGLLQVFGKSGSSYTEEWSSEDFTTFIDECFGVTEIEQGIGELLIFGELGVFIFEHSGGSYQEAWHSSEIPASIKTLHVADIDIAPGKDIIGSSGGYNFIYGKDIRPVAILQVSDNVAEVGDLIEFDGSQSTGQGNLEYYFDFGDGNDTGWIPTPFTMHYYSTPDTYTASLRVRDSTGKESEVTSVSIIILEYNEEPIPFIDLISPNPALEGQNVTLEGHGIDDKGIIAYNWTSSIDGFLGSSVMVETNELSLGTHIISFKVQDTDSIWSDEVTQNLRIHLRPTAFIDSITPNPTRFGDEVFFVGNASDDGSIDLYEWTSSKDGFLSDEPSFSSLFLSLGDHEITFRVKDDDGEWSDDAISYLRINQAPTALIDSISPSSANQGESVTFKGHGNDDVGIIGYDWQSSIDGFLSNLDSFTTETLSIGHHIISLTVTDTDGAISEAATMSVFINLIPTAYIDSISPDPVILGELVSFEGHGEDDGSISSYDWESSLDGFLSSKKSFSTSVLTVGTHKITLKVRDNKGTWSEGVTKTLTVIEAPENVIPIAVIDSVSPQELDEGEEVTFIGHGNDEDGEVIEYLWESDMDGYLSDDRSFSFSDLSSGTHVISFRVKDDRGDWSDSTQLVVVVKETEEDEEVGFDFSRITEDPSLLLFLIIVVLVIIVALVALISGRKKRREQRHY